jgi:hypothetical protein
MFTDKKNETLIKKYGEIEGFNFKIRNLENCKVYLLDWTSGVNKYFLNLYKNISIKIKF